MRKLIIVSVSIFLFLAVSTIIAMKLKSMKKKDAKKEILEKKRYVKTITVKYEDIKSKLKETGRVASKNTVDLSTEVRGKILQGQVALKKGQSFKKGQLLIKIYNEEAKLALQSMKSRFLNSLANILPDLKTDFNENYNTWLNFFKEIDIKKTIPQLPEIKSNKEKIFLASRNIIADYYSIKSSEITLSKYYLYAPFNGTYTMVYAETGAVANPGQKIASMIRTDKLELEIPIEVENINFVHKGQTVSIISSYDNNEFKGKIIRISDFVDPKTQSVSVFIDISAHKNSRVYQGEYMTAIFSDIMIKDAIEVQRGAVFNQNDVYVVEDGKLKKQTVNILKVNDETVIINGLPEGTKIVNEALINAVENMEVEILN
ncbi:MAG: HlyD family efflux transporter periplasmic adaptor subunit [Chlorobi bacterium]|nr:HlyD family efflux transporter periplasmic adaptor subunit [Chlorobiota bacterium]